MEVKASLPRGIEIFHVNFCIGEAWCAVNYLIFNHTSLLSEYLHSYGMVVAFGLAVFALIDGTDTYILRLSAWGQRCTALELCERCIKNEDVDCKFRKVLLLLIPAICWIAFIPLLVSPGTGSYNTLIFDTLYNYARLYVYQAFEIRYAPILALVLLSFAFFLLLRRPRQPISNDVRIFIAAGSGALIFAFLQAPVKQNFR